MIAKISMIVLGVFIIATNLVAVSESIMRSYSFDSESGKPLLWAMVIIVTSTIGSWLVVKGIIELDKM